MSSLEDIYSSLELGTSPSLRFLHRPMVAYSVLFLIFYKVDFGANETTFC